MASIGLCVITKEFDTELKSKLNRLAPYFDELYIQVNGGGTIPKAKYWNGSIYKWNDNFADARNALLAEVKTDYWCWIDSDDLLENPEYIPSIVEKMESEGAEMLFAPYDYQHEGNEVTATQWRERIVKTSLPGKWVGRVHETFVPDREPKITYSEAVRWVHQATKADQERSMERNHHLLELELKENPDDPRVLQYLALSCVLKGDYDSAIGYFEEAAFWFTGEDKYYATHKLAEICALKGDIDEAKALELKASLIRPGYPEAFLGLAQYTYQEGNYEAALQWLDVAKSKGTPKTAQIIDPTLYTYRPYALRALCLFALRRFREAAQMADEVLKANPNYRIIADRIHTLHEAALQEDMETKVRDLIAYTAAEDGDVAGLLSGLPRSLQESPRIAGLKHRYSEPQAWPEGSIVYWCGKSQETWGPDTLDKGMGGSEEAVVYLSRELSSVTVFNQRNEVTYDNEATYLPWTDFNPSDHYDTLIVWRSPELGVGIKANKKLLDLHDLIEPERIYEHADEYDTIMFKSQWHREQYPELPDSKCAVIWNGISKDQFS